jgi:WhiB family redox-sensing transcriptional regulator
MTFTEDRIATEPLDLNGFTLIETAAAVPDTGSAVTDTGTDTGIGVDAGTNGAWEDLASCRTTPNATEVFFSEELRDIVAAKAICADCPVIAPCLEGALLRGEPCGVWGGQLFSNGKILAQKRRRGRPPKVARAEDQLPVVPVPEHLQRLIA